MGSTGIRGGAAGTETGVGRGGEVPMIGGVSAADVGTLGRDSSAGVRALVAGGEGSPSSSMAAGDGGVSAGNSSETVAAVDVPATGGADEHAVRASASASDVRMAYFA